MIQQQQVYPHFVGQQISPGSPSPAMRDGTPPPTTAASAAVRVITETESVRNLTMNKTQIVERHRSISPSDERSYTRSTSPSISPTTPPLAPPPASPLSPVSKKYNPRIIKRCVSVDEEIYDPDADIDADADVDTDEPTIRQNDPDDQVRRPRQETARYSEQTDCERVIGSDYEYTINSVPDADDDAPLDLSLPAGRRRDRTYSGTESDDSTGMGEGKSGGKAAYKKSLMKRYRKLTYNSLFQTKHFPGRYVFVSIGRDPHS